MRRFARFFLPVLLCMSSICLARGQREAFTLQVGTSSSRTVTRGQMTRFNISLEQNQFASIVVEQRGVDLMVRVSGPDQKSVKEFDGPNGTDGPENVRFVALTPGTYFVDVLPLAQTDNVSGRYEIRTVEVRQATEPELYAARAPERLKSRAVELVAALAEMLPQLRNPQNRIHSQAQAAELLWPLDERVARRLASDAAMGTREYIDKVGNLDWDYYQIYNSTNQLRQEVVQLLSRHDPEAALSFLRSTGTVFNPNTGPGQPDQELRLELNLATQFAKKEPLRAVQIAEESLPEVILTQ